MRTSAPAVQNAAFAAVLALVLAATACRSSPTPSPTPTVSPTPTSTPTPLSQPELKYRLISYYGTVFYCDPDYHPIGSPTIEQQHAIEQFPTIQANEDEFAAILAHLGLPQKASYSDAEKLAIYREHKKLSLGVQLAASGSDFAYTLRIGEGQGYAIGGLVTPLGAITEKSREISFNTCPICLSKGTLISTPQGLVPVEQLRAGMAVWTVDGSGARVEGTVAATSSMPVPQGFRLVRLTLADGRSITASPGHPTPDGKGIGQYEAGDLLNGSAVVTAEYVPYDGGATYDLLPSGATGFYWADGILLASTLSGTR